MRGGQRPISDCGGGAADVGTVGIGGQSREAMSREKPTGTAMRASLVIVWNEVLTNAKIRKRVYYERMVSFHMRKKAVSEKSSEEKGEKTDRTSSTTPFSWHLSTLHSTDANSAYICAYICGATSTI